MIRAGARCAALRLRARFAAEIARPRGRASRAVCFFLIAACGACGSPDAPPVQSPARSVPIVEPVTLAAGGPSQTFPPLRQSVAALADGGFAAAWQSAGSDIAMQWITRGGALLFPEGGRLVAAGPEVERNPVVVANPAGGVLLAFVRVSSGGGGQIVVVSFDGEARSRWPREALAAFLPRSPGPNLQLTADPQGGAFVCFDDLAEATVRCQHVDRSGRPSWGGAAVDAGGVAGVKVVPRAIADGSGGVIVVWRNQRDIGRSALPMLMEAQRLSGDGIRLWGEARLLRQTGVASVGSYGFEFFEVVGDGSGGAIVAFDDSVGPPGTGGDVVAQSLSAGGVIAWGGGVPVAATEAAENHEATVSSMDGGVFVAFTRRSGSDSQVWLQRLGPNGAALWPGGVPLSNAAEGGSNYNSRGAFDGTTLWMVWTHQDRSSFELRLARFAADGTRLDDASGVVLTHADAPLGPSGLALSTASTQLFAAWDRLRALGARDFDAQAVRVRLVARSGQ